MFGIVFFAILTVVALFAAGALISSDKPVSGIVAAVVGIASLTIATVGAASSTQSTIPSETQTLVGCGLVEGVVYKTEVNVDHTDYRNLVVVRSESDHSHRACMVREYFPERFVVADGRVVSVDGGEDRFLVGDTMYEQQEAERRRNASYDGNFGQAQEDEPIVVIAPRQ